MASASILFAGSDPTYSTTLVEFSNISIEIYIRNDNRWSMLNNSLTLPTLTGGSTPRLYRMQGNSTGEPKSLGRKKGYDFGIIPFSGQTAMRTS